MAVKHLFVNPQADGADTTVARPSDWNAAHTVEDNTLVAEKLSASATDRVFGRDTAGAGAGEELTLSQVLDFVGSAAEGDLLYRGAATWTRLAKGTASQQLRMNAGATAPEWSTTIVAKGGVDIASTNTTAEEVLVSVTIPVASANDVLRVTVCITVNGNANVKTFRCRSDGLSGTAHFTGDVAGSLGSTTQFSIHCRNATNSQTAHGTHEESNGTTNPQINITSAIQWNTGSVVLVLTSQKATGTDTFTINSYLVERISTGS